MLHDRTSRRRLEQLADDSEQTRNQIRLRGVHGGTLIDFYDFAERGVTRNSSEVIGLGLTFSGFAESEATQWSSIDLSVTHVPGEIDLLENRPLASYETFRIRQAIHGNGDGDDRADRLPPGGRPRHVLPAPATSFTNALGGAHVLLRRSSIRLALTDDRSDEPTRPRQVVDGPNSIPRVNYDLMQTDVTQPPGPALSAADDPPRSKDHVGYGTGDGRIEIVMSFDTDGTADVQNAGGFNVYVMWQTDDDILRRYFEPWGGRGLSREDWLFPDLSVIRPFLLTRRYSYLRDLREALKDERGNLPTAKIQELMDDPPKQTLFARANAVSDAHAADLGETDPDLLKMPNVVHEAMYNGYRILLHPWSGDLRKGMNTPWPAEFPLQWDPAGEINLDWKPELTRDSEPAGSAPQAYRIWITTSDFFDEESSPVPVYCHDDAAGAATDEYKQWLFYPVRRTPIEGPPSLDDIANDVCKRTVTITEVTPRLAYELEVKWSTPFYNDTARGPDQSSRSAHRGGIS